MKLKKKLSIFLMAVMAFTFAFIPCTVNAETWYSSPALQSYLPTLRPEDGVEIRSGLNDKDGDGVYDYYSRLDIDASIVKDVDGAICKYLSATDVKFPSAEDEDNIEVTVFNSKGRTYKADTISIMKEKNVDLMELYKDDYCWLYGFDKTSVLNSSSSFNTEDKLIQALSKKGITEVYTFTLGGSGRIAKQGTYAYSFENSAEVKTILDVYYYDSVTGKLELDGYKSGTIFSYTSPTDLLGKLKHVFLSGENFNAGVYVAVPEGTKIPDELLQKAPTVTVSSDDLTVVKSAVEGLKAGEILGLEVPEKGSVAKEILALVKEKGIGIKVESTSGTPTSWSFASIKNADKNFDPTVTVGAKVEAISNVMKDVKSKTLKYTQVSFAHSGDLPGEAEVRLDLSQGSFEEGKTVYLYYFNPTTKLFEYVDESAFSCGYATFTMTHCSDYIVTSEKLDGTVAVATPTPTPTPTTGDSMPVIPAVLTLLVGMGLLAVVVVRKRKTN